MFWIEEYIKETFLFEICYKSYPISGTGPTNWRFSRPDWEIYNECIMRYRFIFPQLHYLQSIAFPTSTHK